MHSRVSEEHIDLVVLEISISSVELQAIIADPEALVRRMEFGHGAEASHIRVVLVQHGRCLADHQSGRNQARRHVRKLELSILEAGKRLIELLTDLDVLDGRLDRSLCRTQTARSYKSSIVSQFSPLLDD